MTHLEELGFPLQLSYLILQLGILQPFLQTNLKQSAPPHPSHPNTLNLWPMQSYSPTHLHSSVDQRFRLLPVLPAHCGGKYVRATEVSAYD